jgi:integrase
LSSSAARGPSSVSASTRTCLRSSALRMPRYTRSWSRGGECRFSATARENGSSGLRRGELFALRWNDIDEQRRLLAVRKAVYDQAFDTPKTEAGLRAIPLSDAALRLLVAWKLKVKSTDPDRLVFSTRLGKPFRQTTSCVVTSFPRARRSNCGSRHDSRSGAPTRRGRTTRGSRARWSRN